MKQLAGSKEICDEARWLKLVFFSDFFSTPKLHELSRAFRAVE